MIVEVPPCNGTSTPMTPDLDAAIRVVTDIQSTRTKKYIRERGMKDATLGNHNIEVWEFIPTYLGGGDRRISETSTVWHFNSSNRTESIWTYHKPIKSTWHQSPKGRRKKHPNKLLPEWRMWLSPAWYVQACSARPEVLPSLFVGVILQCMQV